MRAFITLVDYDRSFSSSMLKRSISSREARYCFDRRELFGGKAYCYQCQKLVRKRNI